MGVTYERVFASKAQSRADKASMVRGGISVIFG